MKLQILHGIWLLCIKHHKNLTVLELKLHCFILLAFPFYVKCLARPKMFTLTNVNRQWILSFKIHHSQIVGSSSTYKQQVFKLVS